MISVQPDGEGVILAGGGFNFQADLLANTTSTTARMTLTPNPPREIAALG